MHRRRRRSQPRGARRATVALSVVAGFVAAFVAALSLFAGSAGAATTDVQITPTGLVVGGHPAGSEIDIHTGDSVSFSVADVHLIDISVAGFPEGSSPVSNGTTLTFPNAKTYTISWTVTAVLGVTVGGSRTGNIVVAAQPSTGGVGVTVPKVTVPKVTVPKVTVPKVTVPGVKLPKLGLPALHGSAPAAGSSTGDGASGSAASPGATTTTGKRAVPAGTSAAVAGGSGVAAGGVAAGGGAGDGGYAATGGGSGGGYLPVRLMSGTTGVASGKTTAGTPAKTADLASPDGPSAHLPLLLAIIAALALTFVGAGYARLVLLRREAYDAA